MVKLSVKQYSELAKISDKAVYKRIHKGSISYIKVGNTYIITEKPN